MEGIMSLIDSKERIKNNLENAIEHYGDRLKFIGPDCGLSGWYYPEIAYELLHRTHEAIKEVKKSFK
jgi:5-methyltetrahydropteroyltriglutamate--homocysteine methyltransferase